METDKPYHEVLRKAKFLALAILVLAPAIYLVVASIYSVPYRSGGEHDMMFYILFLVAVCQPALLFLIERSQIESYRRNSQTGMRPEQLFFTISIIKFAVIEAIYVFGLLIYLVSGDVARMLAFYPVAIVWSVIVWPRRSTVEKFKQRLEAP